MITYDFSGQNMLVTGGTRGIGRAISEAFLRSGARVFAVYAGNRKAAEDFAAANAEHGDRLSLHQLDVADYGAVERFYQWLDREIEQLHGLINNAGIRQDAVVGMMSLQEWQSVLDTNLTGVYAMSKLAIHKMLGRRYGRIINITSPSGELGFAGQANYAASKAGQIAFTKSLAREVGKRKITVNCVSPGFIDTEFIANLPEQQLAAYRQMVDLKRFGTAREVADSVLFLASEEASYITGATLHVTGGV